MLREGFPLEASPGFVLAVHLFPPPAAPFFVIELPPATVRRPCPSFHRCCTPGDPLQCLWCSFPVNSPCSPAPFSLPRHPCRGVPSSSRGHAQEDLRRPGGSFFSEILCATAVLVLRVFSPSLRRVTMVFVPVTTFAPRHPEHPTKSDLCRHRRRRPFLVTMHPGHPS